MSQTITTRPPIASSSPAPILRGQAILNDPLQNKGTAFSADERRRYGLEGLLPSSVEGLDRQLERVLQHLEAKPSDLEKTVKADGHAWLAT